MSDLADHTIDMAQALDNAFSVTVNLFLAQNNISPYSAEGQGIMLTVSGIIAGRCERSIERVDDAASREVFAAAKLIGVEQHDRLVAEHEAMKARAN